MTKESSERIEIEGKNYILKTYVDNGGVTRELSFVNGKKPENEAELLASLGDKGKSFSKEEIEAIKSSFEKVGEAITKVFGELTRYVVEVGKGITNAVRRYEARAKGFDVYLDSNNDYRAVRNINEDELISLPLDFISTKSWLEDEPSDRK